MGRLGFIALFFGCALGTGADELPYIYTEWESFYAHDGLPSDKIMAVAVDGDRVWVGTDRGLACLENGEWTVYTTDNGLAYDAVISLAVDPASRDVWVGTMGGLSRFSAGRIRNFTQFNSGLPNDVVFGVAVENQNVWVATTSGTGRYRIREDRWDVYTPENSPQHEPWGYFVDYADDKVYAALWGGGLLEFDIHTEQWQAYLDPDGRMEVVLFRDDGIIHVITTGCSYRSGIVWVSTYFGLSSYDRMGTRRWRGYMEHDTGLASDFINWVRARDRVAWLGTDKGVSTVHYDSNRWVTYAPVNDPMDYKGPWEARVYREGELVKRVPLKQGLANNFIWAIDFQGDDVWVATSEGLSRGRLPQKE